MNNGKQAMTIAKEELERQLQDVKVHSEMSAAGAKVKKENLKNSKAAGVAKRKSQVAATTAKSVTLTVAQKTKAKFGQLVEVEYTMPIDREQEAGFDLVYHYSNQFSVLRRNAVMNVKKAHVAADTINNQTTRTKTLHSQLTSLQAEMSSLPNVMTILATSVENIYKLRDGLHAMESALGSLERLCDEVDVHRAKKADAGKAREYQRHANTSLYLQKQSFATSLLKDKQAQLSTKNKSLHQRLKEQMVSFAEELKTGQTADSVSAAGTGSGAATGAVSPGAGAGADATVEPAAALVTAIKTGEQTQRTKMDGTRSSIALTSFSKDNIGVVADAAAAAADDDTGAGIAGDKASTAVDEADAVENEATATKDGTLTPSAAQQESTAADSDQDDGADNA